MISFSALIKLAPFPEDMRQDLLSKESQMSEDQKFRLSETAWQALSTIYQAKLDQITNEMMMEMSKGEKNYSQNDFAEASARLMYEFSSKLSDSTSEEDLAEVKRRLESLKNPQ